MTDTERKQAGELVSSILDATMRQTALNFMLNQNISCILNDEAGYLTAQEICGKTTDKLRPEELERILRYCACIGLIKERARNGMPEFGKSQVTDLLEEFSDQVNAWNNIHNHWWQKAIMGLDVAIKEDSSEHNPFVAANGKSNWAILEENPAALESLSKAMTQSSRADLENLIPLLVKVCGSKDGTRVVDVGGGQGAVMKQLNLAAPHLKCSVFELPQVVDKMAANQTANIKFVRGDMFDKKTIPEGDFVLMRNVLHLWTDEDCHKILRNIHSILPANGSLLLAQMFVANPGESDEENRLGLSMDLKMLCVGGRERTDAQNKKMLEKAGFKIQDKLSWGKGVINPRVTCLTVATKST